MNKRAAIAIAAGGIFWSYAPDRWLQASVLPGEYARAVGRTPVWLFHGADDNIVAPRQDELLFTARICDTLFQRNPAT